MTPQNIINTFKNIAYEMTTNKIDYFHIPYTSEMQSVDTFVREFIQSKGYKNTITSFMCNYGQEKFLDLISEIIENHQKLLT